MTATERLPSMVFYAVIAPLICTALKPDYSTFVY